MVLFSSYLFICVCVDDGLFGYWFIRNDIWMCLLNVLVFLKATSLFAWFWFFLSLVEIRISYRHLYWVGDRLVLFVDGNLEWWQLGGRFGLWWHNAKVKFLDIWNCIFLMFLLCNLQATWYQKKWQLILTQDCPKRHLFLVWKCGC